MPLFDRRTAEQKAADEAQKAAEEERDRRVKRAQKRIRSYYIDRATKWEYLILNAGISGKK